ncbi:MAG: SHOCT domain-containing protein [Clostridia bacterium]|nr:SHOCT domain-containing protein [Clostridia bacterium]
MNKAKFILIILSIVFAFGDVGYSIYKVVNYFMTAPQDRSPIFYIVYEIIAIAVTLAVIVMLIIAIWNNGKLFRSRYGFYMTSIVLSVIVNLTSLATILLISTMFISDWVWVKPKDEDIYHKEPQAPTNKEEMIARLKEMKDSGQITEEQFQEEIMKLL